MQGEIYLFNWLAPEEAFGEELESLQQRIAQLILRGHRVVPIGTSAGVSAVLNLFVTSSQVERVVCIDGRVRKGDYTGRRSLENGAEHNPIFKISVLRCEEGIKKLGADRLASILTLVPWGDEIVPYDTAIVKGAKNVRIWSAEHGFSIFFAMISRRGTIKKFIA